MTDPAPAAPSPLPKAPPPKKKRRLWRWVAGALLLAVVAVGAAVPLAGPAVAAGVIRDYVAGHYSGSAETGAISVSWSGRIVVEDTRLIPTGGGELARIGKVVLDVNLWQYLRGRGDYVILIERPTATVTKGTDGRTNLDIFLQPPAPIPDAPLKPTRMTLTVREGSVDYLGTDVAIPSATYGCEDLNSPGTLKAEMGLAPGGRVTVSGSVALAEADRFKPSGRLEVALRDILWGSPNPVSIPQADLTLEGTADQGTATLACGKTLKAKVTVAQTVTLTASGDMAELAEIFRQPLAVKEGMTLAGTLQADAALTRGAPGLTGSIVVRDLAAVDRAGTRTPIEQEVRFDVDARSTGDRLELTKLALASAPLSATGSVVLAGTSLQNATFDATFDLNLLHKKLSTFIEAGALELGGTVKATVRTTDGAVTLTADGKQVRAAGLAKPLDFTLEGKASVDAAGTTIDGLTLTSEPLTLAASGTIRDAFKIDWTATAEPAKLGAAIGQPLSGPSLTVTGKLTGPPAAPILSVDSKPNSLQYGERVLPITSLAATIGVIDRSIESLKVAGPGFTVEGHGAGMVLEAKATFTVSKAAAAFGSTITGGEGEAEVKLDLAEQRISGTAEARQVESFGNLTAEFDVDLAMVHRFEASSALGKLSASGAIAGPLTVSGSGDLAALGGGTSGAWSSRTDVTQKDGITRAVGTTTITGLAFTASDGSVTRRPKITLTHAALLDSARQLLTVEKAELTAPDGTVALQGAISWSNNQITLETLASDLAIVVKEGLTVTGRLENDGPLSLGDGVSGKFVLRNLATREGAAPPKVVEPETRISLTASRTELKILTIASPAVTAEAAAAMDGSKGSLKATVELAALEARLAGLPPMNLAGSVTLDVTGGGDIWKLTAGSTGIQAKGLAQPVPLSLGGTLKRSGEATLVEDLSLTSEAFAVRGTGKYQKELQFQWTAEADPARLGALTGRPMSGSRLIAEGGFSGPLSALVARIRGSIDSLTLSPAQTLSRLGYSATVNLADNSVPELRLEGPGFVLTGGEEAGRKIKATLAIDDLTRATTALGSPRTGGAGGGNFSVDLTGKEPRITGDLRLAQVEGFGDVTADLDVTWGAAIAVHRCEARSAGGTLVVTGSLPGTLKVNGSGDLAAVGKQVAGRWAVDASVAPDNRLGGALTVTGFSMTTADGRVVKEEKLVLAPSGRLDWPGKTLHLEDARIESAALTGMFNGAVTWGGEFMRLEGVRGGLTYVPQKLGILLGPWLPGKLEGTEPSTLRIEGAGPLTAENLVALLGASASDYSADFKPHVMFGLHVAGRSEGKIRDGKLATATRTTTNEGTFNFDLSADLRDNHGQKVPSELRIEFTEVKINEEVTALLEKAHPMFRGTKGSVRGSAAGSMNFDYTGPVPLPADVQAAIRSYLTGKGSLKIRGLVMEGSPFLGTAMGYIGMDPKAEDGEFDLPEFVLKDGYMEYASLGLKMQGNNYGFRGRVYTTGRLHMDMIIPVTESFAKKQPQVAPLLGSAVVVPIRGTADAPEFGWESAIGDALKRGVKLKLEDELKKRLGDLIPK